MAALLLLGGLALLLAPTLLASLLLGVLAPLLERLKANLLLGIVVRLF